MKTRPVRIRFLLAVLLLGLASDIATAQRGGGRGLGRGRGAAQVPVEDRGIRIQTDRALPGYTLFAPLTSGTTYLIDMEGQVVRTWASDFAPSAWVYMRENGNLVRGGREPETAGFSGGGQGGRFQEFTFDGELIWDFSLNDEGHLPHHDVALLPNGNLLAVVWELKTPEEARRAGRRENLISDRGLWPDMLVEFEPRPPGGARIVWEWHTWDHLIQDLDPNRPNYGDPGQHPERIDINGDDAAANANPPPNPPTDIFHTNSVAYNPELDQIILSVPNFNEVWVIDHSTTSEEARGTTGGRSGKGGDLLYRWGNPQKYARGTPADQRLGFQHDARWIPPGRPGEGHIMIFSNRTPGPEGTYSRVYEIAPPVDAEGRYTIPAGGPFGPAEPVWTYADAAFDATYISGAERLPNGNTLISSGPQGRLFEVSAAGEIVWEYWSPVSGGFLSGNGAANPFSIFRAIRIPEDHPALAGRDLAPPDPQPAPAAPQ